MAALAFLSSMSATARAAITGVMLAVLIVLMSACSNVREQPSTGEEPAQVKSDQLTYGLAELEQIELHRRLPNSHSNAMSAFERAMLDRLDDASLLSKTAYVAQSLTDEDVVGLLTDLSRCESDRIYWLLCVVRVLGAAGVGIDQIQEYTPAWLATETSWAHIAKDVHKEGRFLENRGSYFDVGKAAIMRNHSGLRSTAESIKRN